MKTETIETSRLELNSGQIEGIPANPRNWTIREMEKLKKSIIETPELLELRPPIVKQNGNTFVVLGGNMRLGAIKDLGYESVECIVVPDDMDERKLKEIVIKDNTQLGSWDFDALANEWSDYELNDYGIPVIDTDPSSPTGRNASPVDDRVIIEIELTPDEFYFLNEKLREYGNSAEESVLKILGL